MKFFTAAVACLIFISCGDEAPAGDELQALVAEAMEWNPRVRAAGHQFEQALAERAELRGFFDPRIATGVEYLDSVWGRRETSLQAGVSTPAVPGVYVDAGLEERFYDQFTGAAGDADVDYEQLIQSVARLRVNVPLLQDRGWRQWKLSDISARHACEAAWSQLQAVRQEVRREVEFQYLAALEAQTMIRVARSSVDRAENLLREAEGMVSVQVLPEYQVYAARSAVALRQEELIAARQTLDAAVLRLAEVVAGPIPPQPASRDAEHLIEWAVAVDLPAVYQPETFLRARGNYARIMAQIEADRAARDLEADRLRSNLSLVLETTLQGEDPDNPVATGRYLSKSNFGVMAGLVWSRPWGYRAEKSRVRARGAHIAMLDETLRQTEQHILTELAVAHTRFKLSRERLQQATVAAAAARQALDSEDERFRLGEGRSRNVLDAQKDLTDALKRQILTAVELLRAYFEFNYAAGYGLEK